MPQFVDFKTVKAAVSMLQVLERYGLADSVWGLCESDTAPPACGLASSAWGACESRLAGNRDARCAIHLGTGGTRLCHFLHDARLQISATFWRRFSRDGAVG